MTGEALVDVSLPSPEQDSMAAEEKSLEEVAATAAVVYSR